MTSPTHLQSRALIEIKPREAGESAAEFLQGLVTNDVTGALPVYAALLTPQGKTLFDFFVWPSADGALLLDCENNSADDLAKRLSIYRLRRAIDIARDDSLAVHWSLHDAPADAVASTADPRMAALGNRWIAPAPAPAPMSPELASDAPEQSADAAYLAHRLSLGVPEGRDEMGDILWLETNANELSGVDFNKGCYVGQENTARMNWRGKVNRRLTIVPLDRSEEKRRKAAYPALNLAVDHLPLASLAELDLPDWQAAAIKPPGD